MGAKEKLRELCKARGITPHKLEKDLNFGNGFVGKPGRISSERLQMIAEYFDVPTSYFLDIGDDSEWSEYRETLATSPETRLLLDTVKGASPETLIQIAKIAEALRNG